MSQTVQCAALRHLQGQVRAAGRTSRNHSAQPQTLWGYSRSGSARGTARFSEMIEEWIARVDKSRLRDVEGSNASPVAESGSV